MRVSQIMTSPVIALNQDLPLANAIDIMRQQEISRLVVLQVGRIVGVITEKDIARWLGSDNQLLPFGSANISDLMTPNPITLAPDVMAKRAAEIMLDHDISGLPVVEGEKLVGILTKLDFAKVCSTYNDIYVGQVMEANPTTVPSNDRILHARRVLLEEDLMGLPVVEGRELVGMFTVRDLVMKLAEFGEMAPDRCMSEIRNLRVADFMMKPAIATRTDDKLSDVSHLMLERKFSCLPVLNPEDELVGLLTKTELTEVARERL